MDRIRIVGGSKLNGTIPISGAKNAALPLMIAGLLSEQTLILDNFGSLGTGNVVNNATFAVNRSDAYTFSSVISGTGAFQQLGAGTTTLTADIFGRNTGGPLAASSLTGLPAFPVPPATLFAKLYDVAPGGGAGSGGQAGPPRAANIPTGAGSPGFAAYIASAPPTTARPGGALAAMNAA